MYALNIVLIILLCAKFSFAASFGSVTVGGQGGSLPPANAEGDILLANENKEFEPVPLKPAVVQANDPVVTDPEGVYFATTSQKQFTITDQGMMAIQGVWTAVVVPPTQYTLTVSDPLNGNSITGTGISCPGDCTEYYDEDTIVALTAVPTTGYQFDNWTGDLSGSTNPDNVTMSAAKSVGGAFSLTGGSCDTQSVVAENTTTNGTISLSGGETRGQSFIPTATGDVYSLTLDVATVATSGDITVRIDDDTDMSSEYLDEATATVSATGDLVFTFSGQPELTTSTTYYYFAQTDGTASITLNHKNSGSSYADGSYWYSNSGYAWSGLIELTTHDMVFEVQSCD